MLFAGWSNVATSLAGAGFTGSYIFSQTIFTMRAGVYSRINGFVVAAMMFVIFVAPFSVIEYLPSYFFGSLMIWIGWEIARVRHLCLSVALCMASTIGVGPQYMLFVTCICCHHRCSSHTEATTPCFTTYSRVTHLAYSVHQSAIQALCPGCYLCLNFK